MSNEDTKTPDPFGPEDYAGVKARVEQAFEEATAAGWIGCATAEEAAQELRVDLEQLERTHGLNVLPFPERTASNSTTSTSTEGDAA